MSRLQICHKANLQGKFLGNVYNRHNEENAIPS